MYETYLAALTSGDEALAEQAAGSLTTLPQEQLHAAYEALRAMVDDPEPERRWWAVRALSEIPLREVPSILAKKLTDTDPEVRQCAALGLRLHPVDREGRGAGRHGGWLQYQWSEHLPICRSAPDCRRDKQA